MKINASEKMFESKYLMFIGFFIFMLPWNFINSQTAILSGILFIWTIFKYKTDFYKNFIDNLKFLPLLLLSLFILFKFTSILWSSNYLEGLDHEVNFNKYYMLFVPAILVGLHKDNVLKIIKILTVSFSLYAIYSILIYLEIIYIEGSSSSNPKGHLRFLIVSQYMVIGFFVGALISYYSKIKNEKLLFLVISSLCLICLFINNSRTAQLSFLIIFIMFSIIFFRKYVFNLKAILIFLIICMSSTYLLYKNNKLTRFKAGYDEFKTAIENKEYKGSFGLRLYFNVAGLEILKSNPIIGVGSQDNRAILQEMQKNEPNYKGRIINHFHSEHMDTLTAYGLVGYSLLFFSIVFLIYSLRKQNLYYYMSLAVFLSLFINSLANKTLSVKPLNYIYILFFILFAIIAHKSEKEEKEKIENNS